MKRFILLLLSVLTLNIFALDDIPKREFRGVWVATVTNLDWPSSPFLTVNEQKEELVNLFEKMKLNGFNAIIFQVRTENDALYKSEIEPWSYWLTGEQGKAPSPLWDPLQFAIDEAHKRGMELHAWFNPYRAVKTVGAYTVDENHITKTHPEWILHIDNYKLLNPGIPEVENYIIEVVTDVAKRYNIDGIHLDDYFYPYTPIRDQDTATFRIYNRGFDNIFDWRRDNINRMINHLGDSIRSVKPFIKYGVSPFGIWKNGVPPGILGFDAYSTIYADPIAWLRNNSIDYLTPQLYWAIGGSQDFIKLQEWWADSASAYSAHLYTGHAAYKAYDFKAGEISNQIKANRENENVQGSIFFRAQDFINNPKGISDSLRFNYYRGPSIPNKMEWKNDDTPPLAPTNLRFGVDDETGEYALIWDEPAAAADGDTAVKYIVYRHPISLAKIKEGDGDMNFGLAGNTEKLPMRYSNFSWVGQYYSVAAIDKSNNESEQSDFIEITLMPEIPSLIAPMNNAVNQIDAVLLSWNGDEKTGAYALQVSTDSTFTALVKNVEYIQADSLLMQNMLPQQKYYWRVKAFSYGGQSEFSEVYSFTTGFPTTPLLVYPNHTETIDTLSPTLIWRETPSADSYKLQLSGSPNIEVNPLILDTSGITDTMLTLNNLSPDKVYFWRVKAVNQFGVSEWSEIRGFKTPDPVGVRAEEILPSEFKLYQNYPNPFNPGTTIRFAVPAGKYNQNVTLKLFDILGNEIVTLLNEVKSPGVYELEFNGAALASGIYIYRMQSGSFNTAKKLILMK